jgi:hypothetical protein
VGSFDKDLEESMRVLVFRCLTCSSLIVAIAWLFTPDVGWKSLVGAISLSIMAGVNWTMGDEAATAPKGERSDKWQSN